MKKFTLVLLFAMSMFSLTNANAEKLQIQSAKSTIGGYWVDPTYYEPKAIDGDYNTFFWTCETPKAGYTFTVTLSEQAAVGEIKLFFADGDLAADNSVVEVSTDNSTWTEIGTFNGSEYASSYVTLDANGTEAKYVRMRFTQGAVGWVKLVEFEVYGQSYVAPSRTVSAVASPAEGGTVTVNGGSSEVTAEGNITLLAVAAYGYKFVGWAVEDVVVSTSAEYVDKTDGDKAYVALFEKCNDVNELYAAIDKPTFSTGGGTHLVAGIEFDGVNVPGFDYKKGTTSSFSNEAFKVTSGKTYALTLTYELHWGDIALFQIDRDGTEKKYGYYHCQWEPSGNPYTILSRNADLMCEELGIEEFAALENFTSGETAYIELPYTITIGENYQPGDLIVVRAMIAKGDKGAYDKNIEEGGCLDILLQVEAAETGIDVLKGENVNVKSIYDLTGRRIEAITAPGIYIVNGKKILVK